MSHAIPPDLSMQTWGVPDLPSGFNSCAVNTDFINGPGINDPIWPYFFDSYEGYMPVILDSEDLERFNDCPDICIKDQPTGATVSLTRGVAAW